MADEGDNNAVPAAHQVPHLAFNFKPPSFDGTQTDSARKWLQKFELYADLAGAAVEGRCGLMGRSGGDLVQFINRATAHRL